MVGRNKSPRPTRTTKDFIENQEHAVPRTDIAYRSKVTRRRYDGTGRESADGFKHEGEHVLWAELCDLCLEGTSAIPGVFLDGLPIRNSIRQGRRYGHRRDGKSIEERL